MQGIRSVQLHRYRGAFPPVDFHGRSVAIDIHIVQRHIRIPTIGIHGNGVGSCRAAAGNHGIEILIADIVLGHGVFPLVYINCDTALIQVICLRQSRQRHAHCQQQRHQDCQNSASQFHNKASFSLKSAKSRPAPIFRHKAALGEQPDAMAAQPDHSSNHNLIPSQHRLLSVLVILPHLYGKRKSFFRMG